MNNFRKYCAFYNHFRLMGVRSFAPPPPLVCYFMKNQKNNSMWTWPFHTLWGPFSLYAESLFTSVEPFSTFGG